MRNFDRALVEADRVIGLSSDPEADLLREFLIIRAGYSGRYRVTTMPCCRIRRLGSRGRRPVALGPTPQNYLEKIFQIPFALMPMTSRG
jgi:hypothetical protein